MSKEKANSQALEVLIALRRLGDKLSDSETAFLTRHMTQAMSAFEAVGGDDELKSFAGAAK